MARTIEQLYTANSRESGAALHNIIRIFDADVHNYPEDPDNRSLTGGAQLGITGILQNNFVYSANADWEAKLANVGIPGFQKGIKAIQQDTSRTGILTEKFYQGASYLEISPRFRVVDWKADGEVMKTAIQIIKKLLPIGNNKTVAESYGDVKNFMEKVGEVIPAATVTALADISGVVTNDFKKVGEHLLDLKRRFLWGEPEPVRIQIGKFFDKNNMILMSANVEFSKEMTRHGPLYADFNCVFSSKLALTKDDTGLVAYDPTGTNRVRIKGAFAEDRAFPRQNVRDIIRQQPEPLDIQQSALLTALFERNQ